MAIQDFPRWLMSRGATTGIDARYQADDILETPKLDERPYEKIYRPIRCTGPIY